MSDLAGSVVTKLKSIFYNGRHLVFIAIMVVVVLSAGSITVIWLDSAETKTVTGSIKHLGEPNIVLVDTDGQGDIELKLPGAAVVTKDDARSRFTSLTVGDTVKIRYLQRHVGIGEIDSLQASSPVARGRIIEMDLDKKFIVLNGKDTHVFYIGPQTVILRKGSLAQLEDLKLGSLARAEYRDTLAPKLDLLVVEE